MRKILICLTILSAFYLSTGLVYEEGGFGLQLIIKKYPSFQVTFGGGEEGAWVRQHPHVALPYWKKGEQFGLTEGDWEGGHPIWETAYLYGYGIIWLAWPIFGCIAIGLIIKNRRSNREKIVT